jgi:hypothetical protein
MKRFLSFCLLMTAISCISFVGCAPPTAKEADGDAGMDDAGMEAMAAEADAPTDGADPADGGGAAPAEGEEAAPAEGEEAAPAEGEEAAPAE